MKEKKETGARRQDQPPGATSTHRKGRNGIQRYMYLGCRRHFTPLKRMSAENVSEGSTVPLSGNEKGAGMTLSHLILINWLSEAPYGYLKPLYFFYIEEEPNSSTMQSIPRLSYREVEANAGPIGWLSDAHSTGKHSQRYPLEKAIIYT